MSDARNVSSATRALQAMFALARYAVAADDRLVLHWLASLTLRQLAVFFGSQP